MAAGARMTRLLAGALAVAAAPIAGCGGGSTTATTPSTAATASVGLGSTLAAFHAAHGSAPGTEGVGGPTLYTLVRTNAHGRVIAYQVTFETSPPPGDRERLELLGTTALPTDAMVVDRTPICEAWYSETLRRLIGTPYARAGTVPSTSSAQIRATSSGHC